MIRRTLFSSSKLTAPRSSFSHTSPIFAPSSFRFCSSSSSSSAQQKAQSSGPLEHSWGFAEVDSSGHTDLDRRHDAAVEQVRSRFSDPIVLPNADASIDGPSDFLVGFAQYRWSLRESYRAAIAMALNQLLIQKQQQQSDSVDEIRPDQIDLSVAWTGRFATNKFRGLHKILGVTLLEEMTSEKDSASSSTADSTSQSSKTTSTVKRRLADSARKEQLIGDLATLVNDQKTKCLVEMGIVRAVPRDLGDESKSNKNMSSSVEKEDFDAAVRAVLREIKAMSQQHRVVFILSDQTEAECREKLRPIIFSHRVAPVLINIDDIGRAEENADESSLDASSPSSFPVCLPPVLFDASERRRILLHALGQQYKRSLLDEVDHRNKKRQKKRDEEDDAEDEATLQQHLRLPMIFVNGAYLGTTRHLLRMGKEAKKLATLIHRPSDLKMKAG